jgi:cell division protein ZapD
MTDAPFSQAEAAGGAGTGTLIFEQPLNERMRTFLRLDFLYNQAVYHNEMASPWGSRAAMSSLIDILSLTTRGDVRSDVLKELESQLGALNEFHANPSVDSQRLKTLISNLVRLRTDLMSAGSAFLQPLRDSEFVNAIRHRSAIPGGTCEFDLPDYYFWLSQPGETRMRTFSQWL